MDLPTSRDGEVQAYCAALWTYPPHAMEKSRPIAQLSGPTHLARWRSPGLLRSSLDLPTSRDGEVQAYCAALWTYPPRAMEKSRPIAQLSGPTHLTRWIIPGLLRNSLDLPTSHDGAMDLPTSRDG